MKRITLLAAILVCAVVVKAQTPLTFGTVDPMNPAFRHFRQVADTNTHNKKWIFTKYASISTGFMAFRGGTGSFLSAPIGVQVTRPLSNNLYAYAGLSVAPTYFNLNNSFFQPGIGKNNGFMNANNFGVYSAAHLGLMYISDDKSFSISGGISVGRNLYDNRIPYYTPANSPANRKFGNN
jgi:hypothetical protein